MNTAELLKKVRRIEIVTNRLVNESVAGEYHSVFRGRGMEFDEVREYQPGDDIRSIDWNVTARTGTPHVKRYVEERELTVMLAVDASSSSLFGSGEKFKSETAAELCALLAFAAIKNNDRVGLMAFTDRVELFIPPKKGRMHVLRVIRELLSFAPTRRGTDVAVALEQLNRVLKRRAAVFIASDFLNAGNYEKPLRIAARRHDVIIARLTDPRERTLPAVGIVELEDAETGETMLADTGSLAFRRAFSRRVEAERDAQTKLFRQLSIDALDVRTDGDYVEPLVALFRRRAKRN